MKTMQYNILLPPKPLLRYPLLNRQSTINIPNAASSSSALRRRRRLSSFQLCRFSASDPSPSCRSEFGDELDRLLALLPDHMRLKLAGHSELHYLIEVVMDLGRNPLARFPTGDFELSESPITVQDLEFATSQVMSKLTQSSPANCLINCRLQCLTLGMLTNDILSS